MRARLDVLRQELRAGLQLGEIFGDGERIPDFDAVMGQHRDTVRRGQQKQLGAHRWVVYGDDLFLDVELRELAQKPAPQRPRGIVLTAYGKLRLGHRP